KNVDRELKDSPIRNSIHNWGIMINRKMSIWEFENSPRPVLICRKFII
ncbi:3750_t:CDS:1, partial [Gigaspora rosea]